MTEPSVFLEIGPGFETASELCGTPTTKSERNLQLAQALITHSRTLKAQYDTSWLLEDIEKCIQANRSALELLSDRPYSATTCGRRQAESDDESHAAISCFYELSNALGDRYKHTGQLADLHEQVELLQHLSATVSEGSIFLTSIQSDLGAALRSRFMHSGDIRDIQEAFKLHSALVDRHPESGPGRARFVCDMGSTLFIHHSRFGTEYDIPQSIVLLNEALQHFALSHPCRYMAQYFLAMALWMQHRLTGDFSHLHAAIALYRDITRSQPSNYPDRWLPYNGLSSCLAILYRHTDDISHLNEAVECARHAFDMQNPTNPNRIRPAINLTLSLNIRYTLLGLVDDLQESIRIPQMCLMLSHALRPTLVGLLASALGNRYAELGKADDLDESIRLLREVLNKIPEGHPMRQERLHRLADALLARYKRDKLIGDLTEAICLFRETVGPLLPGSSERNHADCLASALSQYHEDHRDVQYLEEAIMLCETLSTLRNNLNQDDRGLLLHRFAKALRLRYECYDRMEDLNAAILNYGEALDCRPAGHTSRHRSLIELAEVLRYRFEALHDVKDVDKARELLENALICLPDGHPDRSTSLFQLARLHLVRAAPFHSIHSALQYTTRAITVSHQNAQKRLTSALDLLKHLEHHRPLLARNLELQCALLDVYGLTINLLPRVAYFGLDVSSRLRVLSDSDKLAANGAIQALIVSEPEIAIELLEQGRAVFWSQHLRLRTAFNILPAHLATQLSQTAAVLEQGNYRDAMVESEHHDCTKITQEHETAKRRRMGEDFEALIAQARAQPGFERFMLPETFQALGEAAARGPIVVLLANEVICQAVVIESAENVYQIHLSDLLFRELETLGQIMTGAVRKVRSTLRERAVIVRTGVKAGKRAEEVLEALWHKVIRKIIDALKLRAAKGRSRPRITLCPTGVFGHLPLHAAGVYERGNPEASECSSAYFVPSYTPTIGALINARRQSSSTSTVQLKMVVVAVSRPFKWARLASVADEVALVRTAVPSHVPIDFLGDVECSGIDPLAAPTANAVLEKLPEATVLHLACHGYQDSRSPLESGLDKAFLAFLSACESAKGDTTQPDQAIHLAATMLFAGFKSVVGTMWAMDDVDGPIVAQTIYEELFCAGVEVLDPDSIPYALDDAIRKLRARGLAASRWAPYVHLGV